MTGEEPVWTGAGGARGFFAWKGYDMNSIIRKAALGAAIASLGVASSASAATTATANATAEILSTLAITVQATDNTLDFGVIADAGLTGPSTVAVSAGGVRTCGAQLACSGTVDAPTFDITGLPGSLVGVTFVNASETLTYSGAVPSGMTNTMTVSTLNTNLVGNQATLAGGAASFSVGGTLTVNQLQAPGVYTGTVSVSVAYN